METAHPCSLSTQETGLSDLASLTPDQKFPTEFSGDFPQMIFSKIVTPASHLLNWLNQNF